MSASARSSFTSFLKRQKIINVTCNKFFVQHSSRPKPGPLLIYKIFSIFHSMCCMWQGMSFSSYESVSWLEANFVLLFSLNCSVLFFESSRSDLTLIATSSSALRIPFTNQMWKSPNSQLAKFSSFCFFGILLCYVALL